MCLTWIAIIAGLLTGIGSAVIFVFAVKEDYYCEIKKPRAKFGQPDLIGIGEPEDFPSGATSMEVR
jgi:hypothetical protein